MFKKLLAATDGSENSMRAIQAARDIAACMDAAVTLVYAAYVPAMYDDDLRPEIRDSIRADGKRILDAARRIFDGIEVEVTSKLLFDEKAEDGILRLIESEGYDLVIVGSRGLDAAARRNLGSTSMRVIEAASCPVLIVH